MEKHIDIYAAAGAAISGLALLIVGLRRIGSVRDKVFADGYVAGLTRRPPQGRSGIRLVK